MVFSFNDAKFDELINICSKILSDVGKVPGLSKLNIRANSNGLFTAGVADAKAVTSGRYANSAFSTANSAGSYANSAFLAANTPSYTANSAASYANSAFTQANDAFQSANSAALYANGAFIKWNGDFVFREYITG